MTPEKQQIAIAEAYGWHEEQEPVGSHNATAWWHNNDRYPSGSMPVPDFLNSLDAMHEVEKSLDGNQWVSYREYLARPWVTNDDDGMWGAITATAAQRAEAFLRTLNLWED